jgi:predicted Zn-dependent protease with MMP-like domain
MAVMVAAAPSRTLLETMDLWPDHTLLGLYHGVPFPERGHSSGNVRPDRSTLFPQPRAALGRTPEERKDVGRETVLPEVGHALGLDDARLAALLEP